jgi:outer membrane protein assembly factor BamB
MHCWAWLVVCAEVLGAWYARADDWPRWLGPQRDSVWRESGIVEKFPTGGPPIVWRTEIGSGYAAPCVANGRVFVADRQPSAGKERILCLEESSGKVLWTHEYECRYSVSYPAGPRVMPQLNEGRLYCLGAEGNLLCLQAETGDTVWSRDFKKDFGAKTPMWGFAGHPLLLGKKLICLAAGRGSTAVCFDKDTGTELWRALAPEEPGYSSPIAVETAGKMQVIFWHPEGACSLEPETGKSIWSVAFSSRSGLTVATPRRLGNYVFFTSFYDGALMMQLDSLQPAATEVWRSGKVNERDTTHLNAIICTPFLEQNFIYGVCSYGQLRCLKADTGERLWETFKATTSGEPVRWGNAFIVKNGSRFFLFNEKGDLIIATLSPQGYQEVSRAHIIAPVNKDPGRPVVWCHPAFANRRVYVRNDRELVCADLATK